MFIKFRTAIKNTLRKKKITGVVLAQTIDIDPASLSRILKGKQRIDEQFIIAVVHWEPKLLKALKEDLLGANHAR